MADEFVPFLPPSTRSSLLTPSRRGFDELYGDLYGDVEVPVPTAPPPIPAAAAHPQVATTPAAPSLQNPAAIPSFDSAAPNTGRASLPPMPYGGGQQPQQQQQQPPPLHFDAGYSQRAQEQNRSLNVRPSDMPDEGCVFSFFRSERTNALRTCGGPGIYVWQGAGGWVDGASTTREDTAGAHEGTREDLIEPGSLHHSCRRPARRSSATPPPPCLTFSDSSSS